MRTERRAPAFSISVASRSCTPGSRNAGTSDIPCTPAGISAPTNSNSVGIRSMLFASVVRNAPAAVSPGRATINGTFVTASYVVPLNTRW